ncbi:MAG: hypothetical protein Sylvanvirus29_1, partial [Sylvanvirus sp.]
MTSIQTKKRKNEDGGTTARPDVALRYARRKEFSNTCIYLKWSKMCKDPLVRKHMPDLLVTVNKLTLFLYPFLNYYASRLVQLDPADKVKVHWNADFIRMACIGLLQKSNWKVDQEFQPFFLTILKDYIFRIKKTEKGIHLLDAMTLEFKGLSFFINELAAFVWTMCENHLRINLFSRVVKWIQFRFNIPNKKYATKILLEAFDLNSTERKGDCKETPVEHKIVTEYIGMLPTEENIGKNFDFFVKLSIKLLVDMEALALEKDSITGGFKKGVRVFSILPMKEGFSLSHVAFSNSSLQQLLTWIQKKERNPLNQTYPTFNLLESTDTLVTKAWFDTHKELIWNTLFNIKHIEKGKKKFAYRISTNGYSCSITMEVSRTVPVLGKIIKNKANSKHKTDAEYQLPNNFDFKKINRIVGIDPGYTTLFSASTSNDRSKKDCISLSTKQYRHESKMHEQRYYYQNLLKHNPGLKTIILATPSFKTADPEEILKGIDFLVEQADMLFQAFRKSALPKFKFKVKTFSAKTLTQHCKKIVGPTPKTCVVGVGDWSQKGNGFLKGGVGASPNKKFLKELKQRQGVTVVLID